LKSYSISANPFGKSREKEELSGGYYTTWRRIRNYENIRELAANSAGTRKTRNTSHFEEIAGQKRPDQKHALWRYPYQKPGRSMRIEAYPFAGIFLGRSSMKAIISVIGKDRPASNTT
jgi:hypothetical protein